MVRSFTLVVLLSSLLAGWWLMTTTYRHLGARAEREAATPLALEKAARGLEEWRGHARTYAGASLSGFPGIALVRADASSYCLELTRSGDAYHREGPNGAATVGRCPGR
jgi:hypothetical protein